MLKKLFLLLIIGNSFYSHLICQNFHLRIITKKHADSLVIDSLNYNKSHVNFDSVLDEIEILQKKLYKKGYLEHKTSPIIKVNDSLLSTVFELHKRYSNITIYYKDIEARILKFISNEVTPSFFRLNLDDVEDALKFINYETSKNGFPFAKVTLSDIKIEADSSLSANLVLYKDPKKRIINDIVIKGYENFSKSYLNHYLKIEKGQSLDLTTIKSKTEALNNLRFASEIKPPEVLFFKDSCTLYLYIKKENSNLFDGFLGFGTKENKTSFEFDGYLNLSLINNLNYGETFNLIYKSDENNQKNFEANLSLPYLFKSPIGVDLLLRIFKKDSSFTTVNQSIKLHYQINSKHKFYAGLIATSSNNLRTANSSPSIADYKTMHYSLAYSFLKFQFFNPLFPIKSRLFFETNFGSKNQLNIKEKQTHFTINAFRIFNLNASNSFYVNINSSKLNSKTYLENELMRFGGINSIRGFEENSIYATFFSVINSEYRYQLSHSIYVNSITDFAFYENQITKTREKLYGFGFGFGVLTKSGLLKFNYANGKNEDTTFKFSNFKIHLSLTAKF